MGSTTVTVLEKVTQTVDIVLPGPQGPVGDVNPQMFTLRDAAQTAATSAQSSATSASGSAATATTQATRSADWAEKTVGTVDGVGYSSKYHAQLASTSAQTATTKASEASASATSASGSASTASTKASEASTSATNAAASATAAATSATDTANALVGERSAVATLTNKTVNLSNNTLTGTTAQFNAALTDGDFATLAGAETLTNKTITGGTTNPTTLQEGGVDAVIQSDIGTEPNKIPLNQYLGPLAYRDENPAGAVVGTTAVQVLSGKSFSDNVWIGTGSHSQKLSVIGNGAFIGWVGARGGGDGFRVDGVIAVDRDQDNNVTLIGGSDNTLRLRTGSATKATLDASGNLGLGVTPSAWGSNYKALQINSGGAGIASTSRNLLVAGNAYNDDAAWKYVAGAPAAMYNCNGLGGQHEWHVAPSGTAGQPISFTQAMSLVNSSGASTLKVNSEINTASAVQLTTTGGVTAGMFLAAPMIDHSLGFQTGGSERLRINSAGNVGIGTSSPACKLDVFGTGTLAQFSNGADANLNIKAATSLITIGTGVAGSSLALMTSDIERMRLDASGNLGLGVVPSAWSSLSALHVKGTAHFAGFSSGAEGAFVTSNAYFNGTNWIYQTGAAASNFRQSGGAHIWYTAPSGAAGDPISFTQAMTLSASGHLLIGATSSDGAGSARAQIGNASAATTGLLLKSNTSSASLYASSTSSSYLSWKTGTFMALGTAPDNLGTFSEAARITSEGYLRMAAGSGGIQFNGDTAAANALDDYEEGTFTPTIVGSTAAGAGTYTKAVGRYTKVGNVVHFDLYLLWTAHTGTGNMLVADMPFVNSSLDSNYPVFSIFGATIALTANNTLACFMTPNSSQIQIQQLPVGGGANQTVPLDTSAELLISGSYRV